MCKGCRRRSKPAGFTAWTPGDQRFQPAFALWRFERDAPVRLVLHRLKYGNCPWIGYNLGLALVAALPEPIDGGWDLIVPVPLHPMRLLERGYNQSEWIARGVGRALRVSVAPSALSRKRNTKTQTNLMRHERHANVDGAFALGRGCDPAGRRVLLIDDTLTTGATLAAAAGVLLAAGAEIVQPAAVARATLRMEEEQPDIGPVIPSQLDAFAYGPSTVGNNL